MARPSHHTVGPALPLRANKIAAWGGRYQPRSFQPIAVGSSEGRNLAHGAAGGVGATSSGRTTPGPATVATSIAWTAATAARVSVRLQPVHHLMSVIVPGPKARNQARTSSVRAVAASQCASGAPSQDSSRVQRYWLDSQVPTRPAPT